MNGDVEQAGTNSASPAVRIDCAEAQLTGELAVPPGALGLVLFAHGSGSSRHSPRNQSVAAALRGAGLGTLLFDLLTPEEESRDNATLTLRFNIEFLAERLMLATAWVQRRFPAGSLRLGYFGASTGGAAALVAAAKLGAAIEAVVSRGGRPDLARAALAGVCASTLLIVGQADEVVLELNRTACAQLRCEKRLEIVPGAGHLFEEPGALEAVASLSARWFAVHFRR